MAQAATIERLQRLLTVLPHISEDGCWLADLISTQLEASEGTDGRSLRAQLIQDLAAFYPGRPSRQAKDIARDARRYAAACWPRDKIEGKPPEHHRSKAEAVLFELHRNAERGGARWPLAWRIIHGPSLRRAVRQELHGAESRDRRAPRKARDRMQEIRATRPQ